MPLMLRDVTALQIYLNIQIYDEKFRCIINHLAQFHALTRFSTQLKDQDQHNANLIISPLSLT